MWQHRAPNRPTHDVSQVYNSGICTVYRLEDVAAPGLRPRPQPTQLARLPYEERSLGINRYFAARQNQIQIERVIRVPVSPARISNKDIVQTEDGETYAIEMIQKTIDTYPASLDLSLVAYKQEGWTDGE